MAHGQDAAAPCANGCGFFGSAATKNLCSKCYLHVVKSFESRAKQVRNAGVVSPCAKGCGSFGSAASKNLCASCYRDHLNAVDRADDAARMRALLMRLGIEAAAAAASKTKTKAAPNRCAACKKKVGLLGFACRCGGKLCSTHRYAEEHACDFDYRKAGQELIAKQNPLVVAPKINKI